MGLFTAFREYIYSVDRHQTANTRALEALFVEKPWVTPDRAFSVIRQGLADERLCSLAPDDLGLDKPFYTLCKASQRHERWLALPMTPRWLKPLGLSADSLEQRSRNLPNDIYSIESLPSGLRVVSPHVNAVAVFYGVGASIIFQTNERKDPVFRAAVQQAVEEYRRKRDENTS